MGKSMTKNKAIRKKIEGVFVMICLLILCVSGCAFSEAKIEKTTIELKKDGSIVQTIVEDFPAEYSLDELMDKNRLEVEQYNNSTNNEAITIKETTLENGKVTLIMKYNGVDAYQDLNNVQLFSATLKIASALGYDMDVKLTSAEDGRLVTCKDLALQDEELHLAIVSEATDVKTYKEILYVSEGVSLSDNKKLATIEADKTPAYIVFK